MNRVLVVLATIATILGTATAARVQMAIASDESPFRFQFEQTESPRGLAVEGYVYNYNALPWRITNVRLQVDRSGRDAVRRLGLGSGRRPRPWARLFLRPRLGAGAHVSRKRPKIRQGMLEVQAP